MQSKRSYSDSDIPSKHKKIFEELQLTALGGQKISNPSLDHSDPIDEIIMNPSSIDEIDILLNQLINEPQNEHQIVDAQTYLSAHRSLIVNYLNEIAEILQDFGKAFGSDTTLGRIFFEAGADSKPKDEEKTFVSQIDEVLRNDRIIACFNEKFLQWQPLTTAKNILYTKKNIVNYFFNPIERSVEWTKFQKTALKGKYTKQEQRQIRDTIAGALTYKILTIWCNQFDYSASKKGIKKVAIFTNMVSSIGYPKIVISNIVDKVKNLIKDELNSLYLILTNKNFKPSDIADAKVITKRLQDIRENIFFCSILSGERILQESLTLYINQLKNNVSKEMLKVTAEQMLLDLNTTCEKRLDSKKTSKLPLYFIISIEQLTPLVDKEVKKKCARLFACHENNSIIIEKAVINASLFKPGKKTNQKLSTRSQEQKKILHLPESNALHQPISKHKRYSTSIGLFKQEKHHTEVKPQLTVRSQEKKVDRKHSNHQAKEKRRNSSQIEQPFFIKSSGKLEVGKRAKSNINLDEVKAAKASTRKKKK